MSTTPSHLSPVSAPPSATHGRLPEPHHHHHRSSAGPKAIPIDPRGLPLLKLMVLPLVHILPDGRDEVFGYRVKLPYEAFAPKAGTPLRLFSSKVDATAEALALLAQEPKASIDRMLEQEDRGAKRRERSDMGIGRAVGSILERLTTPRPVEDAPKPKLTIRIPPLNEEDV
jgi:hypothetical protein